MKDTKSANATDDGLFQNLTASGRALLARHLRHTDFAKGAPVLRKGQQVSGAYRVISGQLRVFTLTPQGKEATLYLINPGETCVLALNCIFNDLLYPAWVEASKATRAAIIPGAAYRELYESETSVRNLTVQAFSVIVFRLMAELEEIHSSRLEQRLANFLLLHATSDARVTMTQQEIAAHLGTTREQVARALGRLTTERLVQTRRHQITLRDPLRLAEFAKGHTQTADPPLAFSRRR